MTRILAALCLTAIFAHSTANAATQSEVSDSKVPTSDTTLNVPSTNNLETHTTAGSGLVDQILPHVKAGWNSQNDAPRGSEQDGSKYSFLGKQEFYLGGRISSGWALSFMYTTYQYTYSDPKKPGTQFQIGDPSVTVGFPTIFKSGSWSLNSQFRYYYPVSHYYVGRQIQNVAYYLFLNGELPGTNEFVNILIPRYFYEPHYTHGSDTNFYYEDRTQVGHRFSPWFRAGLGQWTQNEFHARTADGFCMDIYPYADFIINKNLYFGPRYSFPVVASGAVFEGPERVSLREGFAELWLQASI